LVRSQQSYVYNTYNVIIVHRRPLELGLVNDDNLTLTAGDV
jgi:hypothetical protein